MQEAIQSTTTRRRPPQVPFALPADDRLTDEHSLIDVAYEGKLFFVFHADIGEVSLSFKPSKADYPALMDSIKGETLTIGDRSYPLRGAVREAFHHAVIESHYRSL